MEDTNRQTQSKNNTLGRCYVRQNLNLNRIAGKQPVLSTPAHALCIFRLHSKGFKAGFVLCSWSKAWQNTTSTPVSLFPGVYRIWNCRQVLLSLEIHVCVCSLQRKPLKRSLRSTHKSKVMCSRGLTMSTPIPAVTGGAAAQHVPSHAALLKRG